MLKNQIIEYFRESWKQKQNICIDSEAFVAKFSDGQNVRDALSSLKAQGYIEVVYADDKIYTILLNSKFENEFA